MGLPPSLSSGMCKSFWRIFVGSSSSAAEHLAELRLRRSLSSLGLDLVHMWTPDREHPRTRETGDLFYSTFVTLDVWVV